MKPLRWFSALMLLVAMVAGGSLLLQRRAASQLRKEMALLRTDRIKLAGLKSENQRLMAAQAADVELATLRSDRTAVMRLRSEIEVLRTSLQARERALTANDGVGQSTPTPPALALSIAVDLEGKLSIEGRDYDLSGLKQQIAALPRGSRFEIQLQTPKTGTGTELEVIRRSMRQIADTAKELAKEQSLKMELRLVGPYPQ